MFKFTTSLLFCVFLFVLGCSQRAQSGQVTDETDASGVASAIESQTADAVVDPDNRQGQVSGGILQIDTDPPSEISAVVRSIFQDSTDKLWIGCQKGLYCHDGDKLTCYLINDDFGQSVTIKQVVEDRAGNIWCATTGGVTRIEGNS
jgi:ligand-binding sensor domain-containing protein